MRPDLDFSGKIVLVTGSTRGIGLATARAFAEHGGTVIVNSRHGNEVAKTVEALRGEGFSAAGAPADIGDAAAVRELFGVIARDFGRLDVLVNNAGIFGGGGIESITGEAWHEMLKTNLEGTFRVTQAALELMKRERKGAIVNISSRSALIGSKADNDGTVAAGLHYIASKGAILSFTRGLAREVGPFGIRANAVIPAHIPTAMTRTLRARAGYQEAIHASPLGRCGTPEEVASVCLFLASDLASYVTGEAIAVGDLLLVGEKF